jgi:hypothetical protein
LDQKPPEHSWIMTAGLRRADLSDLDSIEYNIEDIAHSLSMQCRWGGHCQEFYSVAEHSVLLYDYAMKHGGNKHLAKALLLHDASESYLADVPRPAKKLLPAYVALEDRLQVALFNYFGLDSKWLKNPLLKELDLRICCNEIFALFPTSHPDEFNLKDYTPLEATTILCLTPKQAKEAFLKRF